METNYYHKNSEVVAFERFKNSNGYSYESTYDDKGNELTFKNSKGYFSIKDKEVSKQEFENFVNRPCVGKKVIVDGVEYELK